MPNTIDVTKLNDHELLIVLHTKFDSAIADLKELKDGTSTKITLLQAQVDQLEKYKASVEDLKATNTRVDRINTRQNMMMGGLIVINILIPFIINYLSK
jgi:outer membrane murein-binding lipoprotein Lpp